MILNSSGDTGTDVNTDTETETETETAVSTNMLYLRLDAELTDAL